MTVLGNNLITVDTPDAGALHVRFHVFKSPETAVTLAKGSTESKSVGVNPDTFSENVIRAVNSLLCAIADEGNIE